MVSSEVMVLYFNYTVILRIPISLIGAIAYTSAYFGRGRYFNYTVILRIPISLIGAIAYTSAYFGRGSGGIFLDNVGCSGTESTLLSCYNPGIGVHNCHHSEDAGVRCLGKRISSHMCNLLFATEHFHRGIDFLSVHSDWSQD